MKKKTVVKRKKTTKKKKDDFLKMSKDDIVQKLKEMGQPGESGNIYIIKEFLESTDDIIHKTALESLRKIGGDKAVEAIEEYRARILDDFDRVCHLDLLLREMDRETPRAGKGGKLQSTVRTASHEPRKIRLQEIDGERVSILSEMLVDPLSIEIGEELISIADPDRGGGLLERIGNIRKEIAMELGLLIPGVIIMENREIPPTVYDIKIKGVKIARGETIPGYCFAVGTEEKLAKLGGKRAADPTYGLPGMWIPPEKAKNAREKGCMVFDDLSVITVQMKEIIRTHASDLLGRQDLQMLIDNLRETHPAVVEDLRSYNVSPGKILKILKNLLKERVSIRDLVTIMETIADNIEVTGDVEILTECVRCALSRSICSKYVNDYNELNVITFDPKLEQCIIDSIVKTEVGTILTLDPDIGREILERMGEKIVEMMGENMDPVLLCAPQIRAAVQNFTRHAFPMLPVLSWNEIPIGVNLINFGAVSDVGGKKQDIGSQKSEVRS